MKEYLIFNDLLKYSAARNAMTYLYNTKPMQYRLRREGVSLCLEELTYIYGEYYFTTICTISYDKDYMEQ